MRSCFLVALISLASCSKKQESAPTPAPAAPAAAGAPAHPAPVGKDPEAAKKLIASGALVLDVRTPDEYAAGHLDSALNVPVDTVTDRLPQIESLTQSDKSKPIVVYCEKGGRAARAKQTLEQAGYTNVVNGGGYNDLK